MKVTDNTQTGADVVDEPTPSFGLLRAEVAGFVVILFFFAMAVVAMRGVIAYRETVSEYVSSLQAEFEKVQFSVEVTMDGSPQLRVYSGKASKVLARTPLSEEKNHRGTVSNLVIDGLARTNNGNYFTFVYSLSNRSLNAVPGCPDDWCRVMSKFKTLSPEQAKNWYRTNSSFSVEGYKRIFLEDVPSTVFEG